MTSHVAYVEPRITQSIFAIPLDFEIARLTCIYSVNFPNHFQRLLQDFTVMQSFAGLFV